jgi:hypothetical protein
VPSIAPTGRASASRHGAHDKVGEALTELEHLSPSAAAGGASASLPKLAVLGWLLVVGGGRA